MLFNSVEFLIFLPVVFFCYWFVTNSSFKLQNALIASASYLFYGWWDWRFLGLIFFSTVVDYSIGLAIARTAKNVNKKFFLWCSVVTNLGLLGVFKYYNFFLDSLYGTIPGLQVVLGFNTLDILLPVGISFYTFQTMSYTIDIYKKQLAPTSDFIAFAAFVSFFPQLVAGPIERASNLLPQFSNSRSFRYSQALDGMRQILWGLFKKIVIADSAAQIANEIFNNSEAYSGSTLFLGAVFFAFQIYGDFSGYSDIAIGTAKLFGINLMQNFAFPYFSRDIAEFWRRWHISLSTWFRDYLYIPLGGSRGSTWFKIRNTFIIFLVSGFWHGANWTFVIWGALNAVYFLPLLLSKKNRNNLGVVAENQYLPNLKDFFSILMTFFLTTLAWIFFRAENVNHALEYLSSIFSRSVFSMPYFPGIGLQKDVFIWLIFFLVIEWIGRRKNYGLQWLEDLHVRSLRRLSYVFLVFAIFYYSVGTDINQFIYFQF